MLETIYTCLALFMGISIAVIAISAFLNEVCKVKRSNRVEKFFVIHGIIMTIVMITMFFFDLIAFGKIATVPFNLASLCAVCIYALLRSFRYQWRVTTADFMQQIIKSVAREEDDDEEVIIFSEKEK